MAQPKKPQMTAIPELNYENKFELDINSTGPEAEAEWADMGKVLTNISPALNENVTQATYYADGGFGHSYVTGGQMTITCTGDVSPGDPVSDYLTDPDRLYNFKKRQTYLRITRGNEQIIWACTLAKIQLANGDANGANALTVEIHCNGKPSIGTVE